MLIAALLAVVQPVRSDAERRAGLEEKEVTASNGVKVRSITTRVPPEQYYDSLPGTTQVEVLKDPKVMLKGGWTGYAVFELHHREETTPMAMVRVLHFSKSPESLSNVEVFGEPAPSIGVRFTNEQVSDVSCLKNGACPRSNMVEFVIQPKLYRRLLTERHGIPVSFVSSRFGRISMRVPQAAVDAVLEVAASGNRRSKRLVSGFHPNPTFAECPLSTHSGHSASSVAVVLWSREES